jgi:hypothetical protein
MATLTLLPPLPSAPTFHATPCCLHFGNAHSPRVVSNPQQLLPPPSAPVFPVWEPISHRNRFHAPAPLALFALGWQYHECIQYRIPTAKSSCSPTVAMGFAGLCAAHHIMSVEENNFVTLCSALSQEDNPLALSVFDPTTGIILEHCQLRRNPRDKATWDTLYANELGHLCQGISSGESPSAKRVAGTNTVFCIDYHDIPAHKQKEICHRKG